MREPASWRWTSRPVSPSICRSMTRQSGRPRASESRNAWPEWNASASISEARSSRTRALRTDCSSSTTATNGRVFPIAGPVGPGPDGKNSGPSSHPAGGLIGPSRDPGRQGDEFGDRADLELGHHPAAVDLDRLLRRAELRGNLLVELAATISSSTSRSRASGVVKRDSIVGPRSRCLLGNAGPFRRPRAWRRPAREPHRLGQERHGAGAHRLDAHRNAAAGRDEDDRPRAAAGRQGPIATRVPSCPASRHP